MPYHKIDPQTAVNLITAFLTHEEIGDIGVTDSIGGLIDLDMTDEEGMNGWSFWYCWNTTNNVYPRFFVAYEPNVYPDDSPGDVNVLSDYLYKSYNPYVFKYPSNLPRNTDSVYEFILNQTKEWDTSKTPDPQISGEDVSEFSAAFLSDFNNAGQNPYNDYSFNFFTADEVTEFVGQGEYVRYFFGYDSGVDGNAIRLILVSVERNGSNQLGVTFWQMESGWPPNP